MQPGIFGAIATAREESKSKDARKLLGSLIQEGQYVGEVFSLGYETALVQIHDFDRMKVGGIPSLSFLIATRLDSSDQNVDPKAEDTSVILLRVMDAAPLPNEAEALRVRVETAQRVSGELNAHWDASDAMDASTHHLLSYAGIKCRVIGTFFLDTRPIEGNEDHLVLRFGSDISNYYPNRGLKVFKPNDSALTQIVNYRDPDRDDPLMQHVVKVGEIRYASTNRSYQGISNVPVNLVPVDLLGQKTALFGMTRTGKSNTTKVVLKAVFDLRYDEESPLRVGQIVFDPNGEYANENVQDADQGNNPSAIKNVAKQLATHGKPDVVTYGIHEHPNDPNRNLMLLNFFEDENLQFGKEIIDGVLADDSSKFIQNFRQVVFERPSSTDKSATVRYNRRVLVYRALLARAGFAIPPKTQPLVSGLINSDLLNHLEKGTGKNPADYQSAASIFKNSKSTWQSLGIAFSALYEFMMDKTSTYASFEQGYVDRPNGSGDPWADEDLKKLLEMFRYPNGARQIGKVAVQHSADTTKDYKDEIYDDLYDGRLVIVDQSSGDPVLNRSSADRIMWHIFRRNQEMFRKASTPPDILIYIEEAHNLLPQGSDDNLQDIWVRTAKEGAKYRIGMVYATQEVSSIQRNILKNTANWFIGHLNNTDETRELCKYYDFADFENSIRRAQDRGFLRVKTLSNMFVIPAQIHKFQV